MIKQSIKGLEFSIRIMPNSSKNDLTIINNFIKVKVTAPPVENKANKALIELLSKLLKVPKTSIEIIKGTNSKEKMIRININDTTAQADIIKKLTK